jgi:hypothetical protein
MAYARVTDKKAVIVVINNDTKPAGVSFDISMIKQFAVNETFTDELGNVKTIIMAHGGYLGLIVPGRSAAILTAD